MENQNSSVAESKPQLPSAFKLFGPSLSIIGRNFETFLALILGPLVLLIVGVIFGFVSDLNPDNQSLQVGVSFIVFILMVATAVLYFMFMPGLIVTQLRGAYGKSISPREAVKTGLPFFWRLVGLSLLLGLIYAVSFILLIVPFFFMYKRYILAKYYLVERNLGIKEAMRQSAEDSKQYSSPLWGLVGVTFLIEIVPFANWILPILYSCAPVARFKEIMEAKGVHGTPVADAPAPHSEKPEAPADPVS
jgi:hypothetical protein